MNHNQPTELDRCSLGIPASAPVAVDAVLKINGGEQSGVLAAGQAPGGDDLLQKHRISKSARSDPTAPPPIASQIGAKP